MKKLFSIFSSNIFFFLLFSLIALSLAYTPSIYHFLITPSNRVYTGTVFFSDDYAVYTSVIQQGIDGRLTVVNKYTSEPHEPSLLRFNYLLLGKIGGTLGLSSIMTYHFSRLALGVIFLLLCLYLILNFVPKNLQRLSFLFILFSYSWPKFDLTNPVFWLKIQPVYLEPSPVVRFATQPHFQIGAIYSIIAILFFLNLLAPPKSREILLSRTKWDEGGRNLGDSGNLRRLILSSLFLVLSFFAALTDPAQVLVIHFALFLFIFYLALRNLIKKVPIQSLTKIFITLFLTISSSLPSYFYLRHIFSQEPWVHIFPPFESMQIFPQTFPDFFLSFGPVALFAAIGLFFFLGNLTLNQIRPIRPIRPIINFDNLILICISWVFSTIILIFFLANPLQINRLRFFHAPLFIPLAILAAYGISCLSMFITKRSREFSRVLTASCLFIILGLSAPLTFSSFMEQVKFLSETDSALIYPPKTHVEAYNFLKQNTNRNDIVVCLYESCNQIPYFSGNTVFLGNITETLNEGQKSQLASKIFSGTIQGENLKIILTQNRIKYLFVGYQEAFWQTDFDKYPFLSKVYQNPGVSIFRIL